jgi:hypothetical protein
VAGHAEKKLRARCPPRQKKLCADGSTREQGPHLHHRRRRDPLCAETVSLSLKGREGAQRRSFGRLRTPKPRRIRRSYSGKGAQAQKAAATVARTRQSDEASEKGNEAIKAAKSSNASTSPAPTSEGSSSNNTPEAITVEVPAKIKFGKRCGGIPARPPEAYKAPCSRASMRSKLSPSRRGGPRRSWTGAISRRSAATTAAALCPPEPLHSPPRV